jgi:hypothetical protein
MLNEGQSPELVGRPAMYREEVPGACFQNHLIRFRTGPRVDAFALLVFRHFLHSGVFRGIARWSALPDKAASNRAQAHPQSAPYTLYRQPIRSTILSSKCSFPGATQEHGSASNQ